jgi:hypothetical protein
MRVQKAGNCSKDGSFGGTDGRCVSTGRRTSSVKQISEDNEIGKVYAKAISHTNVFINLRFI